MTTRKAARPASGQPRYGLRWRLRDMTWTVAFTIRHRPLRYWGLGLLAPAAVTTAVAVDAPDAFTVTLPLVMLVLAGALLLLDDVLHPRLKASRHE